MKSPEHMDQHPVYEREALLSMPASLPRAGHVLIITTCWWPSVARLAHLFATAGCGVSVLCPRGHSAHAVPGINLFKQQAFRPIRCLSHVIAACQPTLLVPADDRVVAHLHELHRTGSMAERQLIEQSLGSPDGYDIVRSRVRFMARAQQLGIAVPENQPVTTPAELGAWLARMAAPWVIKVNGAWAGHGVRIAATAQQAHSAFRFLHRPLGWASALKCLLVNRDPFWLADWLRRTTPEVSVQAHVDGWPGNLAMFCRDGEVLAATVAEVVTSLGETGPSTIIRLVDRPEFRASARLLARELRLSGFYGLDFMVERATDRALLIEMNPRVTALANIRVGLAGDLIAATVALVSGRVLPPAAANTTGDLVAHFPLAWHVNREDPRLADCYQDVPREEPALLTAMLRPTWPERQILARILGALSRAPGPRKIPRMLAMLTRISRKGMTLVPGLS